MFSGVATPETAMGITIGEGGVIGEGRREGVLLNRLKFGSGHRLDACGPFHGRK